MHLEHRFCRFEALFCGVYIFVLPSSVFSPLSSLFSPQNPQKCRFEPTFTKRRYKEALRAKKPDFMRLFAQTKRPEAVTKLPAFCKMTKRLEIFKISVSFVRRKSSNHAGLSQFKKVNILLFCPVVLSSVFFRISGLTYGELSEWSKVQHSKCVSLNGLVGSNPTVSASAVLSAIIEPQGSAPCGFFNSFPFENYF